MIKLASMLVRDAVLSFICQKISLMLGAADRVLMMKYQEQSEEFMLLMEKE